MGEPANPSKSRTVSNVELQLPVVGRSSCSKVYPAMDLASVTAPSTLIRSTAARVNHDDRLSGSASSR